ncbi:hypothetical protein MPL3365_70570 [Mesorhizobium plurifarium]|uniref:Uncharacterized protein n=1 Tax=Mesorhizobium plurifarium TaxID=69974 RepID=A0A090GCX9_MESPL|nr:hypothetical protein MPL3365_70570 [Mesorhizobium plurifarium]
MWWQKCHTDRQTTVAAGAIPAMHPEKVGEPRKGGTAGPATCLTLDQSQEMTLARCQPSVYSPFEKTFSQAAVSISVPRSE